MNKFKIGDKVVNIINEKRGIIVAVNYSRDDVNKTIGKFTLKYGVKYEDNMESLNSIVEIEKLPDILDEKEKEYLRNVIKPFKDRVLRITKYENDKKFFLKIETACRFFPEIEVINLPWFKGNMYKGMEGNKKYTLKDLDLQ